MNKQTMMRLIAMLAVLALFTAACGNDDSDDTEDGAASGFFSGLGDDEGEGEDDTPETTTTEAADDEPEPETTTTTSARTEDDADPVDSDYLFVVGDLEIPEGDSGELAVVAMGPSNRGWMPALVRNRTGETYYQITVTGPARDADGTMIGSANGGLAAPAVLGPGEWGIVHVAFGVESLPDDATFDLSVSGGTSSDFHSRVDLVVNETNQIAGSTFDQVIGTIENGTDETASGPLVVTIACFTSDGDLSSFHSGSAGNELTPGATTSFSVDLFEATECGPYVVAASGYVRS